MSRDLYDPLPATPEETDEHQQVYDFGEGGVPWYLLLFYLAFLTFFTYYVLENQLPDFTSEPPIQVDDGGAADAAASGAVEGAGAPVEEEND